MLLIDVDNFNLTAITSCKTILVIIGHFLKKKKKNVSGAEISNPEKPISCTVAVPGQAGQAGQDALKYMTEDIL